MGRTLAADTDTRTVYLKFINKARIEANQLTKKLDRLCIAKEECYKYLFARRGAIAIDFGIILDDYIIEFKNQVYNPELALDNKVSKFLRSKSECPGERRDIIQLAKWCSILENENSTFNRLRICKKEASLSFSEFRQYLFDFYSKVHKVLLDGDAYKFTHGIGTMYFKRFEFSDDNRSIDYAATKKRKQEIIDAGKIPYNKIDAINAEHNGVKYEGIPYLVYQTNKYGYVVKFENSKFFRSHSAYEFKTVKYLNAKYRDYSYEEIIEKFCNSEDDIAKLQVDMRTKLSLLLIMNPGVSLRFERNTNKYENAIYKENS